MNFLLRTVATVGMAAVALIGAQQATAQAWPSKPLRLVVPLAAGGGSDILARVIGHALSESIGKPVIIDNRPGASGIIGVEVVARAVPDGYTFLLGSSSTMVSNVLLYKNVSFDPVKDFVPLAMAVAVEFALVVPPSLPVTTVQELITLAKSRPGQLNYGFGTSSALQCLEAFKADTGVDIFKIAYTGTPQATNDLIAGRLQVLCEPLSTAIPNARAGKLRALAITSRQRSGLAPELPTVAEAGVPGFEFVAWIGFFAPAGAPIDLTNRLSAALVKVLSDPEVGKKIRAIGFEPTPTGAEDLGNTQKAEMARMVRVFKGANIKPE